MVISLMIKKAKPGGGKSTFNDGVLNRENFSNQVRIVEIDAAD